MKKRILTLVLLTFICNLFLATQLVHFNSREETSTSLDSFFLNNIRSAGDGVLFVPSGRYSASYTWGKEGDIISFEWYTNPAAVVDFWIMDESDWQSIDTGFLTGYKYPPTSSLTGSFTVPHDGKWYLMFSHPAPSSTYVYYSIETTPYLLIYSPHSETSTYTDSSLSVNWRTNYATWIQLDLYKGSSFITTLKDRTYNDGSASVHIPWDYLDGNDYKIKISDDYSDEFDFSESFTIRQRKITVLFPMENDVYVPHTTRSIGWNSLGVGPSAILSINLFLNSTHIFEISNQTENDGDFKWKVRTGVNFLNFTFSHYQIRIQESSTQKYLSLSPLFTITKEKSMNIISPLINDSFTQGKNMDIAWETDSTSYKVDIKLKRGNIIIQDIISVRNSGSYSWKIPSSLHPGTDYYIFIKATDNSTSAISETFTIKPKLKQIPSYNFPLFLISIIMGVGIVWKKGIIKTRKG
ncbi:hypothetical protein LCGC14_1728960, partial [marine sediment metagenome]